MRILVVLLLVLGGCKSSHDATRPEASQKSDGKETSVSENEPFTGDMTRGEILADNERWASAYESAVVDNTAATRLAEVEPGAKVTVWLGVWCGDSVREVARWWKALDQAGDVPFDVELKGVARGFSDRYEDLEAVPTFVVTRDGEEVGRVVETSVDGIESDVLALLSGEKTGKISASR